MKKQLVPSSLLNIDLLDNLLKSKSLKDHSDEMIEDLEKLVSQYIVDKSKEIKNKSRIIKNDLEKDQLPAEPNLTKEHSS